MSSFCGLNPEQKQAVEHVRGPLLVLAGAGSGKTRVVTERIAHLIQLGTLPGDILAVTFTNKAAEEMRERIHRLCKARVLACTFHSLGARILRESISSLGFTSSFSIYDEEESEKLLKTCLQQLAEGDDKKTLKQIRHQISQAKNNLLSPEECEKNQEDALFIKAYTLYQKRMKECNALDFDDLLYLTVKLLQDFPRLLQEYQKRWLFLLIDEYQDTNEAQYRLTKLLVAEHQNLFAVGDPDQSIYSWRGARYQNILNFHEDFPQATILSLEQNYRSTQTILQGANALIQHNEQRFAKNLWSDLGEGEKIGVYTAPTEKEEAHFIVRKILFHLTNDLLCANDVAIFYRTNAQSRPLEDALLAKKIPYTIVGGLSFYQRKEIKDLLAFLKMILSDSDLISFLRTIHLPKRGIGKATLDRLVQEAYLQQQPLLCFLEEVVKNPSLTQRCKIGMKQKQGLSEYLDLIQSLRKALHSCSLSQLIQYTIESSRYLQLLQEEPDTYDDRRENLDELIAKAKEWEEEVENPSLFRFLEDLCLYPKPQEEDLPKIQLMTLHNSKGLEFPLVFLAGLEEDLFPHVNAKDHPAALEEERRLCYVGITRGKKKVYLTCSLSHHLWGVFRTMRPSRFLQEIPSEFLENLSPVSFYKPPPQEPPLVGSFRVGDRVVHSQFGQGVIRKSYEGSLGTMYDVYFTQDGTERTLVARYAKLKQASFP